MIRTMDALRTAAGCSIFFKYFETNMMKCLSAPSTDGDNRDEQLPSLTDYNNDDNCKDPCPLSTD